MAKIQEETYTVKLSKLIKDEVAAPEDISDDRLAHGLEGLVQQMVDVGVIVEVIKN